MSYSTNTLKMFTELGGSLPNQKYYNDEEKACKEALMNITTRIEEGRYSSASI